MQRVPTPPQGVQAASCCPVMPRGYCGRCAAKGRHRGPPGPGLTPAASPAHRDPSAAPSPVVSAGDGADAGRAVVGAEQDPGTAWDAATQGLGTCSQPGVPDLGAPWVPAGGVLGAGVRRVARHLAGGGQRGHGDRGWGFIPAARSWRPGRGAVDSVTQGPAGPDRPPPSPRCLARTVPHYPRPRISEALLPRSQSARGGQERSRVPREKGSSGSPV